MSNKVFITGIGIISSIGTNVKEVLDSIKEGKSGIGYSSQLSSNHKNELPVGEIKLSNARIAAMLGLQSEKVSSRTALLGIHAALETVSNIGSEAILNSKTGLISGTSVGGMDRSEIFFQSFINNPRKGRLRNVIGHDCGYSTEKIAEFIGVQGFVSTISTACSSSANSIMLGARMIAHSVLDRCIVGGVDSLTKFTLNGFNSLQILDKKACRPFDNTRTGLNLGEGAGFLLIESERVVDKQDKRILCEISGFGNACDAHHQTASSPEGEGAYLAMNKALKTAGLKSEDIDYINAHGTGTPNNDLSEGKAIEKIFKTKVPKFSSTKSFTGHTLGAAGGIEAVLSVLAIKENMIMPNLNFKEKIKELKINPVAELITGIEIKHVLSNSFGFGGNNTSLIFSKC